jgi:hypothetical protein
MTNFKRKLLAVAMTCFVSGGAFAQKRGEEKQRPPKDTPKVVVQPKEKPPQNNNQSGKRNDGKKGKG